MSNRIGESNNRLYNNEGATKENVTNNFPVRITKQGLFGGFCWISILVFFIGQAVTQVAVTTPYSLITNQISDLGVTSCDPFTVFAYHATVCSPLHNVMNGSMIAFGLLEWIGAIATRHVWPKRRLRTWGLAFLVVGGMGAILAGFAPENLHPVPHIIGAVLGILFTNAGVVLLGITVWKASRWAAIFAMFCGIVGLIGFFLNDPSSEIGGLIERMAGYPAVVWLISMGGYLVRFEFRRERDLSDSVNFITKGR